MIECMCISSKYSFKQSGKNFSNIKLCLKATISHDCVLSTKTNRFLHSPIARWLIWKLVPLVLFCSISSSKFLLYFFKYSIYIDVKCIYIYVKKKWKKSTITRHSKWWNEKRNKNSIINVHIISYFVAFV